VVLAVTLTAKSEERTIYVVEVQQAGIFTINGFPEPERSHLLGAYCPNALFAYAREAISDLVTKGSFPQVVLQPVNFEALFLQHQQKNATRQAPNGEKRPILN
jgi:preprotein translocase subunit SecB